MKAIRYEPHKPTQYIGLYVSAAGIVDIHLFGDFGLVNKWFDEAAGGTCTAVLTFPGLERVFEKVAHVENMPIVYQIEGKRYRWIGYRAPKAGEAYLTIDGTGVNTCMADFERCAPSGAIETVKRIIVKEISL